MSCPVCGTATVSGGRFCFSCGAEDQDPEQVGAVTDRVLALLATIVRDYGGHVDKLVGDGIMAVFGAPTAHEEDAERALRATGDEAGAVEALIRSLEVARSTEQSSEVAACERALVGS